MVSPITGATTTSRTCGVTNGQWSDLHVLKALRTTKRPIDLMRSLGPALDGSFYRGWDACAAPRALDVML